MKFWAILLSGKMEQDSLLFDSDERYEYLHLKTSKDQIISAFNVWSYDTKSVKLVCFWDIFWAAFSVSFVASEGFLTKLILLLPDGHLSKCFFPFAWCFTFSIPLLAILTDFQQTLQKALASSLSSLYNQVLNSSSTSHESGSLLLYFIHSTFLNEKNNSNDVQWKITTNKSVQFLNLDNTALNTKKLSLLNKTVWTNGN